MHACFIVSDEPEIQITFNFPKLQPISNIVRTQVNSSCSFLDVSEFLHVYTHTVHSFLPRQVLFFCLTFMFGTSLCASV